MKFANGARRTWLRRLGRPWRGPGNGGRLPWAPRRPTSAWLRPPDHLGRTAPAARPPPEPAPPASGRGVGSPPPVTTTTWFLAAVTRNCDVRVWRPAPPRSGGVFPARESRDRPPAQRSRCAPRPRFSTAPADFESAWPKARPQFPAHHRPAGSCFARVLLPAGEARTQPKVFSFGENGFPGCRQLGNRGREPMAVRPRGPPPAGGNLLVEDSGVTSPKRTLWVGGTHDAVKTGECNPAPRPGPGPGAGRRPRAMVNAVAESAARPPGDASSRLTRRHPSRPPSRR